MAAKKKAAKKKAVAKKKTGTSMAVSWQDRLSKHATDGKSPVEKSSTGDWIGTKGGKFVLGGTRIGLNGKGLELDCIIVGFIFEKSYYDGDYVEGESNSPACFALGYDEDALTPHELSPASPCDNCEDCPMNEWESAKGKSKGKACADRRRLALAFEGADGGIDLKYMNIPPTFLSEWRSFHTSITEMGLHPMQCAVRLEFDEESTAVNPPVVFNFVKEITNDKALQKTANLLDAADKVLEQPYDVSNYKKPKGGKNKTSKKKTAKKKGRFSKKK